MTIRRGESWGEPGELPPGAPVLADDRAAAEVLQSALDAGAPLPTIGLVGGDLHRTLGAPRHDAAALRRGEGMSFPIDVGLLELLDPEGTTRRPQLFLAHLVARSVAGDGLWKGRTVVVMNAAFHGTANLGPRAHPNDGRLDVTDGELGWSDRRAARQRAELGSHVPHPALAERRVKELEVDSEAALRISLDGVEVARSGRWRVRCLPDAVRVVV